MRAPENAIYAEVWNCTISNLKGFTEASIYFATSLILVDLFGKGDASTFSGRTFDFEAAAKKIQGKLERNSALGSSQIVSALGDEINF